MSKKSKEKLSKEDKQFFEYQRDFYKATKLFMDRGDILQKKQKDRGAIAPTEVLMFLLFWGVLKARFNEGQLDFISMMFEKIMFDDWMKGQMVDPPTDMQVEVRTKEDLKKEIQEQKGKKIIMPWDKKKETIH
jgi:hypothetical protein